MLTFIGWMNERARLIDRGHFARTNPDRWSDEIKQAEARAVQRHQPADPFVYGRAMMAMNNGIFTPQDIKEKVAI